MHAYIMFVHNLLLWFYQHITYYSITFIINAYMYFFLLLECYYMLLEDCLQQRMFASFWNLVCKGNLLHVTDSGRWFIHDSNPKIFVNCERTQVLLVQFDCVKFLLAIKDLNSRYNLLVNKPELLANIASLTVGDKVEVRFDSKVIPVTAVIRYIGPLGEEKFANYFGIEILVGIE